MKNCWEKKIRKCFFFFSFLRCDLWPDAWWENNSESIRFHYGGVLFQTRLTAYNYCLNAIRHSVFTFLHPSHINRTSLTQSECGDEDSAAGRRRCHVSCGAALVDRFPLGELFRWRGWHIHTSTSWAARFKEAEEKMKKRKEIIFLSPQLSAWPAWVSVALLYSTTEGWSDKCPDHSSTSALCCLAVLTTCRAPARPNRRLADGRKKNQVSQRGPDFGLGVYSCSGLDSRNKHACVCVCVGGIRYIRKSDCKLLWWMSKLQLSDPDNREEWRSSESQN